jgi:hemolysin activation/secretion protein
MRALLLLNENMDLAAGALFQKGEEFGTADLIIEVQDRLPIHLYLNANNYGRKLTTNFRAGGRLDYGNVLMYGDLLSIAEVVGFPVDALYFTDVKYRIPLTSNGAFLEFEYLYSKFDVETLRSFHLSGKSVIGTVKGGYALTRSRNLSVDFFSYFDFKQIQNFAFSSQTSYDKLRVVTAGFLIDHYNPCQGRDYLNVRVGCGIPGFLGGLGVVAPESSNPPAGGRFILFNADTDRLQHLWKDYYLYLHGSAQYSPNRLTVPEQIYIGGSDTVRGYPLACALGNSGYYANVELRIPPPLVADLRFFVAKKKWREIVQVVGFLDQGAAFQSGLPNIFIWGSGVGFRFKGPWSLSLSLDVGFPLNHRDLSTGAFTYIKVTGQPF